MPTSKGGRQSFIFIRAKAPAISYSAIIATTMANPKKNTVGASNNVKAKPPNPTPTAIEAGRLRPARDFLGLALCSLVGSGDIDCAAPSRKARARLFN